MGNYSIIRFKGFVKPEFCTTFSDIAVNGNWKDSVDTVFKKFGELGRSRLIPTGGDDGMPTSWKDERKTESQGFLLNWDSQSGYWAFQCSLKNYEDEIEHWFDILPYFIDSIEHLEYFSEGLDLSKQYDLVDGRIVKISDDFICYEDWEDILFF